MKDRRKKRLTGRKVTAYTITNLIVVGMFIAIWFKTDALIESTIKWFIFAILFNMLTFVSINSVDKFLQSKFFNKE